MAEHFGRLMHGVVDVAEEAEPGRHEDGGRGQQPLAPSLLSLRGGDDSSRFAHFVSPFISRYPCGAIPKASGTRLKKANMAVMYTASAICGSVHPWLRNVCTSSSVVR